MHSPELVQERLILVDVVVEEEAVDLAASSEPLPEVVAGAFLEANLLGMVVAEHS